jgi:UDPglucose--hexose-1-phosphate uridylyltransferase
MKGNGMVASERLRRDPVTGKLAVIAPERRRRPGAPAAATGHSEAPCPFCPGNEALTPPEIDSFRRSGTRADAPGWHVRVVPNKYPAFPGGHEVIIHSPDHERDLGDMPAEAAAEVLRMYRRRLAAQFQAGARAAVVICNRGARAGASLDHPHSQLFALPVVPPLLVDELANFERFHTRYGGCLLCEQIEQAAGEARLVRQGPVVAWVPAAARWPYEIWLAPREHADDFRAASDSATAAALRDALRRLDAVTGGAALNFWLHTAPADLRGPFHWHLELAPRTTVAAGFELATDATIDEVEPAAAAAELRAASWGT